MQTKGTEIIGDEEEEEEEEDEGNNKGNREMEGEQNTLEQNEIVQKELNKIK